MSCACVWYALLGWSVLFQSVVNIWRLVWTFTGGLRRCRALGRKLGVQVLISEWYCRREPHGRLSSPFAPMGQ